MKTICGVPLPILQRLAQPFNELDDLTVYSEVFEPFLERSLPWQKKLRDRRDAETIYPYNLLGHWADRFDDYRGLPRDNSSPDRGFSHTGCTCTMQ